MAVVHRELAHSFVVTVKRIAASGAIEAQVGTAACPYFGAFAAALEKLQ